MTHHYCKFDSEQPIYNALLMLTIFTLTAYGLARLAESNNQLEYENRSANIIAGFLKLLMRAFHTTEGDLEITTNTGSHLITMGPHRTGWEAIVLASKIKGTPPQFFTTDAFNALPGVSSFLNMFKVITVEANAKKGNDGRSANARALDKASTALKENGCVALFPQGNFSKLGQEPPRVYAGAAKLAVTNNVPIHVVRLDGYWCLQNPLIPVFVRNHLLYRSFFSGFHLNNVRSTLCCVIDFHLNSEHDNLSEEQKIEEISARLYAYYRHTQELTIEEIDAIKTEISAETHLSIWRNKVEQDSLQKNLLQLKEEAQQLEEPTLLSMQGNRI